MSPTPAADPGKKLPLWRLIAGILVLASMVGVLLSLAPVYLENRQLHRYMETLVAGNTADPAIQAAILARAKQLDLPVLPDQVKISHPNSKLAIEIKYAVQMDFSLYQVNVHFHPSAKAR
jgi:hypothetical protein